jgi:hypothetical protein
LLAVTLLVVGCDETPTLPPEPQPPTSGGERFDRSRAGTIRGRVLFRGSVPAVAPFRSIPEPLTDRIPPPLREWPNPNAPAIDAKTSALGGAVVWLQSIDPAAGRPWDHPGVRVEMRGQQFHVLQGSEDRRVGLVRARDSVELVSRDPVFHSVQVRGSGGGEKSSFFTCTLPDRDKVVSRRLESPEVVELASAAGYYWMRAYLFVGEHPYFAHTDPQGRFTLTDVPAGSYKIVAWHPNWRISAMERNPDTMRVQHVRFGPPLTSRQGVTLTAGQETRVELCLGIEP